MENHSQKMMMRTTTAKWTESQSVITQSLVDLVTDSINAMTDTMSVDLNDTNITVATTINTEEVSYKGYQYRPETYIVPIIFGKFIYYRHYYYIILDF